MFESPLRYPGGKGRLSRYVSDLIELNDLTGCDYVEPYAGGAGIALPLLYLEYASHVHLNDLDRSVYAFWRSVLDQPDALCKLVTDAPVTVEEWERQKAIQTAASTDLLTLGFSTFYLNRANRSGIISGGIIGGKNQTGKWKIDARFNKNDLTKRIEKVASYAPRITLHNLDASDFIRSHVRRLPRATLVYLDPPYYVKGRNVYKLYQNNYNDDDHKIIASVVARLKQNWIVSYDDAKPIREFYASFRQQEFKFFTRLKRATKARK